MTPLKRSINNMRFSIEAKVGIIGLVTIAVLIWGINYLKGKNILSSTYTLYAFYPESGGLETSAPVMLNGVKIGYVDEIELRTGEVPPIKLTLNIEKEYRLATGSVAELYSADLMGTRAIRIIPSGGQHYMGDQDTVTASLVPDLITNLQSRFFPLLELIGHLAESLDTLSQQLGTLVGSDAIGATLDHLAFVTGKLRTALLEGGDLDLSFGNLESFTTTLAEQGSRVSSLIGHLNSISEKLDSAGLDRLAVELVQVSGQLNTLLEQVNSGEGNAGKLFYSDTLYRKLELLIADLDHLVRDLNENPEDYVQISLFGRSEKKK
jgi:phospholipid/cholesterol/gamma-HCH transport system substrate-binding protein